MDFKKIVLHLPAGIAERLMCFPVIHTLYRDYPEAEFHFMSQKKDIDVFLALPFRPIFHEIEEKAEESKIEMLRTGLANKSLYEMDLFLSLVNHASSSVLGMAVESKARVGYEVGWSKIMWTKSLEWQNHLHPTANHYRLLTAITEKSYDKEPDVFAHEQEPIVADWNANPYMVINLPFKDGVIEDQWFDLLDLLKTERIIIVSAENEQNEELKAALDTLIMPKYTNITCTIFKSWHDLARLFAYGRLVVSGEGAVPHLACYVGTPTVYLSKLVSAQTMAPLFLGGKVMLAENLDQAYDQFMVNYLTSPC